MYENDVVLRLKVESKFNENIDEFVSISKLTNVYFKDTLNLPMYDRYLIIGRK
mgnify:CR=1 FL=1